MKNFIKLSIGMILGTALVLSPVMASANNGKGNDKGEKDEVKTSVNIHVEKDNSKNCIQAWGHLFAFGWLKNHEKPQIDGNCLLPFGIAKKFGNGNHATSTPDTVAPVITNVTATTRIGDATITWNTDENSDSGVFFSTTSGVNTTSSSTPFVSKSDRTKNHKITLSNLAAGTTYYAVVRSKDPSGNIALGSEFSFTTKTPSSTGDVTAPIIKNIVGVVSTSTIKVGFLTNEFTSGRVYYGTGSPVNPATATFVENTGLTTSHLLTIPNLALGTKYFFVIEAKDIAGNITRSTEFSFTTSGTTTPVIDTTAPIVSAISTTVSSTTINVNWTTNEPATSKVFYNAGSSIDINASTTPFVSNSSLTLNHSVSLSGLSTSTSYQMVIESADGSGNKTDSVQFSAITPAL